MTKAGDTAAKSVATMTSGPQSMAGIARGWEKTQASVDPVFAAQVRRQKEVEKAFQSANAAVAAGLATHDQAATAVGKVATHYDGLTAKATSAAFAQTTLGKALAPVNAQLVALSAGAGPVGTFLASMGPWGIAAAVGLGTATAAFSAATNEASRFSNEMLQVRDAARAVDLSTLQLQGIKDVGEQFALSGEKINATLQRFTAQMDDFRKGQGELFGLIKRIDPALADEMAATRDNAAALQLLSKAYEQAGTSRQKLDRLIGGRNGGSVGLLFESLGDINQITSDFEKSGDAIDKNLIDKVAKLRTEIDNMAGNARNNFASIFSVQVLELEKEFVDGVLSISRVSKDIAQSDSFGIFVKPLINAIPVIGAINAAIDGIKAIKGLVSGPPAASFDERYGSYPSAPLPTARPAQTIDRDAAQKEINALSASIAAMGAAATASDRLALIRKKAALDLQDHIINEDQYRRAIGAAGLEVATTAINARVGALGLMASASDIATQAQLRINKANIDGAGITGKQKELLIEQAVLQSTATKQNTDAQYGLASSTDILNQKTAEYLNTAKQRQYTDAQTAKGLEVVKRNAQAAYEASQTAASATPGLTQLAFDAGNANKQFDQFAVSGLNSMTNALADITMGTASASEGFRNLGLAVIRSLEEMIIKMTIVQPMAEMLKSTLGGGTTGGIVGLISGLFGGSTGSAKGNVFDTGAAIIPHSLGGVVSSPSIFPMSGGRVGSVAENEPEAIMPLKRGRDGRLGVAGAGNSQPATVFTYAPTIDARGADATAVARLTSEMAKQQRDFGKNVMAVVGKARMNLQG